MPTPGRHDPYAALRSANYRLFALGFVASSMVLQMLGLAIGWEIYERTADPQALGYVGLARALPVVLFALPAGYVIDHLSRKWILVITQAAMAVSAIGLAFISHAHLSVGWLYVILVIMGAARAFNGPSRATLLPQIVAPGDFHNAVTWNSGVFQFSAMIGPILGGFLLDHFQAAWPVYLTTAVGCSLFAISASFLRPRSTERPTGAMTWRGMFQGAGHVYREKTILSTLTLDLFAVLLGGATALLPIYAKDILHTDARGLGLLVSSQYIGAFVMALVLAHRPPFRKAGPTLLWSVAAFGLATIVFGLSTSMILSLVMLFIAGAVDNISVVVRHVLVQMRTPDELRGRVSSVNSVFIECSNQLGAFESGTVANYVSPVFAVVSGGIGTVVVVALVALRWPELRRLGELKDPAEGPPTRPPPQSETVPAAAS